MANDSELIDRIREYVLKNKGLAGTDWKNTDTAMNVDTSSGTIKGMAFGGDPMDPQKDNQINKWLSETMNMRPGATPIADEGDQWLALPESIRNEGPSDSEPSAFDADKTPVKNDQDSSKIESSHPGVQPDELDRFLQSQESQIGKWGPDKEAAVMQNLTEGYKKPGYIASEALAGLGDAIMQGVSRAGPGGALNAIQRNKENAIKNAGDTMGRLQEGNYKQIAAKNALQGMSSKTPLGASETPILAAVLEKMGYPPQKIQGMLRNPQAAKSALQPMTDVFSAQMKAQLEAELKKLELTMQGQNLALTHQERRTQQQLEKEKEQADVAKTLQSRGVWRRMTDKLTGNPATKVLESQLPGNEEAPTISSDEEYKALPRGTVYKTPEGKRKVKS